jgi:hypothetical protein
MKRIFVNEDDKARLRQLENVARARAQVSEIVWGADATRYLYDLRIVRASELYSHLEPGRHAAGR